MRGLLAFGLVVALLALAQPAGALPACSFGAVYYCVVEESSGQDCGDEGATGSHLTAVGAGVGTTAGASAAGVAYCYPGAQQDYVVATASVGGVFVNVVWVHHASSFEACYLTVSTVGGLAHQEPCPADLPPPNPGWGSLLG